MSLHAFTSLHILAAALALVTALLTGLVTGLAQAPPPSDKTADKAAEDFIAMTPDQIKAGIENRHPAAYYILARKLFTEDKKDEGVFWFYAGQLRYRFHLAANPTIDKSGDPALFASLSQVLGAPFNEYAFGDLPAMVAMLDKVLAWDEKTNNGFTSKTTHAAAWKDIRDGLGKLRAHILANGDQIRAQRKQNGLDNRKP